MIQDEKKVNWLPEPGETVLHTSQCDGSWQHICQPVFLFVFYFLHLETKQSLFQRRKDECSGIFSHCLLSTQKQENYPHKKTEQQS